MDYHFNFGSLGSSTTFNVTTPAAGAIDPRRVGVRPSGAYWGAAGEQIDMLSGNLNFTLPLLKAQGRGSWGVPFALSYNSQMWRREGGQDWKMGRDVGYGLGWRLQAGSLTPYWSSWSPHHYVFTDSTGAEYRLDVNTNGIWTSREGIYVEYEEATYRLYFPDGSFWVMGGVSAGTEADSGTRYPTLMQDTNGNQILVRYDLGVGVTWPDSSARIKEIEDVRAVSYAGRWRTYAFTYTAGSVPHLTGIDNFISTSEKYDFGYGSQNLYSPISQALFGGAALLAQVTVRGLGIGHTMEYNPVLDGTSGELTRVVQPLGGWLRWAYRPFTYVGSRSLREVQYRYLGKAAGAAETTYTISRDDGGDAGRTVHYWADLYDPGGVGNRAWWFYTDGDAWRIGLVNSYAERQLPGYATKSSRGYTWLQDSAGNPYIGAVNAYLDQGTADEKHSKTEQTLDIHGNVTQTKVYDYGNLVTPARTYTNTYLSTAPWTPRHIWNRLATTNVNGTVLVTNAYDAGTLTDRTGLREHDPAYTTALTARGNLTSQSTPGAARGMTYDIGGAIVSTTDGYHTATSTLSATTNYAAPDAVTPNSNPNLATSFAYSSFLGITAVTGPNGASAGVSYDTYARPTVSTSPHGASTTYTYTYNPATVTATTGTRVVKTYLDGLGRAIKVETGDTTSVKSVVETEYDSCACSPLGKVKRVSRPYAPGATVYWTTYSYDTMGRTVTATAPDGSSTSYLYQGNCTTITDPAGKWKKHTIDAMGHLVQVSEPAPGGGTHETTYTYNVLNQLTGVSMPRGGVTQTRTFNYNLGTGRLMSATNPETGTVSYTYNGDGSLATKTDARNQQIAYTYDGYGRLTQAAGYTYYYDSNPFDPYFGTYTWGRVAAASYSGGTSGLDFIEMYSYTRAGAQTAKRLRTIHNGPGYGESQTADMEATFAYDNEGHYLGPTKYPGLYSPSYSYTLDTLGRPVKLTMGPLNYGGSSTDIVAGVAYGAAGQLTQINGETRSYNTLGQLTRITGGGADWEYRYAAGQNNGRITQMKDWVSGEEVSYAYDSLNRLIQAVTTGPQYGLNFAYDGWGNLTSQQVFKGTGYNTSLGYNGLTNRMNGYGYDDAGNLTAMPYLTMSYDAQSRLIESTHTVNGTTQYGYSPNGQRVWTRNPAQQNWWSLMFYGPDGRLMSECGASFTDYDPNTQQYNVFSASCSYERFYFAGKYLRRQTAPRLTEYWGVVIDNVQAITVDRLGSAGKYYPYGEARNGGTDFATYLRDGTGLDYANARYYSSQIARFTTADPYKASGGPADPQSWNRYAYVHNDPINFADGSGLQQQTVGCGAPGTEYCIADGWYTPFLGDIGFLGYNPEGGAMYDPRPTGLFGPTPVSDPSDGSNQEGYDQGITSSNRELLQKRTSRLGNCTRILGGASASDFWAVVKDIKFYDGRPSSPGSGRSQNDVASNGISTSLAATVQYDVAQTLRGATGVLPAVVLGRDYYNDPSVSQADTLLHEALHVALNMSDADLKTYLAQYGFKPTESGSHDITDWLQKDCPK